MTTYTSPLTSTGTSPRRAPGLAIVRWLAVVAAVVLGALAPFTNGDDIRRMAVERTPGASADELDLTVTMATWFGAIANVITVAGACAVIAGVCALALRRVAPARRRALSAGIQLVAATALSVVFLVGIVR